jgi:hypothetical protein
MSSTRENVASGVLMSYGGSYADAFRSSASMPAVLKGEARRPAGAAADQVRAVHQSDHREGDRAEDPGSFLLRADEVIE